MSIEKRMNSDGIVSYSVRYRLDGRNRRRSFARKKDAAAFEAKVRIAARQGELTTLDAGRMTLGEFAEQWWEKYVKAKLATATVHSYASAWNLHVLPYLGEKRLRDITPRLIEEWRFELEQEGVGAQTVKKSMAVLQSCLQRAVVWGEIQSNPCREVKKPAGRRRREIRPVPPLEVERMRQHLLEADRLRDATLVSVLAYAGLRPEEALAITWEHVRENTILVEQAASYGELKGTKTGAIRSVRLLSPLREDLAIWRVASGGTGFVFPSKSGGLWTREAYKSWARKSFRRAALASDRGDVTPYTLRHSFASLLIHEGRSVVEVAAQMGHAPTVTLGDYAHVFADLGEETERDPEKEITRARAQTGNHNPDVPKMYPSGGEGEQLQLAIPLQY
jgi:integrase